MIAGGARASTSRVPQGGGSQPRRAPGRHAHPMPLPRPPRPRAGPRDAHVPRPDEGDRGDGGDRRRVRADPAAVPRLHGEGLDGPAGDRVRPPHGRQGDRTPHVGIQYDEAGSSIHPSLTMLTPHPCPLHLQGRHRRRRGRKNRQTARVDGLRECSRAERTHHVRRASAAGQRTHGIGEHAQGRRGAHVVVVAGKHPLLGGASGGAASRGGRPRPRLPPPPPHSAREPLARALTSNPRCPPSSLPPDAPTQARLEEVYQRSREKYDAAAQEIPHLRKTLEADAFRLKEAEARALMCPGTGANDRTQNLSSVRPQLSPSLPCLSAAPVSQHAPSTPLTPLMTPLLPGDGPRRRVSG